MTGDPEEHLDVVVFDLETRVVTAIVGRGMRRTKGHYNAEKRLATILGRINPRHGAEIVASGSLAVGGKLPQ